MVGLHVEEAGTQRSDRGRPWPGDFPRVDLTLLPLLSLVVWGGRKRLYNVTCTDVWGSSPKGTMEGIGRKKLVQFEITRLSAVLGQRVIHE